jgi:ABC-type spermidine/putrescine transport system permease subunit II
MLAGAWGALVPFVGPYFGFAYTPDKAWAYTSGRLWLSVLPGAAAVLGGLFILASDRIANAGALLAAAAGTWFVVGIPVTALALPASQHISAGLPVVAPGSVFGPATMRFLETLGFFYGLGIVILFVAALALGEVVVAKLATRRYRERMAGTFDRTDEYGPAY